MSNEPRHCDSYIIDIEQPLCLRWYLFVERLPASDKYLVKEVMKDEPVLFAMYNQRRVRVVMASSLGDVGITYHLNCSRGYTKRVPVASLSDFTNRWPPA